ncbi:hypothetical protein LTR16_004520 [Cryomyces antarcticus]|uniref:Uncharacterized protein n=1 Tax=Cryomyces antarcticus TaxID=329879 RepID=A0ABR0M610_9PEZI|nr:hypothetical protein LTR60_003919 [Cryomyces antarcticus]KAK5285597.1 hypothetical protein LTR16_004520 [Cryomyces antarcticus]
MSFMQKRGLSTLIPPKQFAGRIPDCEYPRIRTNVDPGQPHRCHLSSGIKCEAAPTLNIEHGYPAISEETRD